MTQNLVISNDKDAEFVQFTTVLPSGYDSFSIDSVNGSMINQNFLKIGDSISFSFSNNPLVYYDPTNPKKYGLDAYLLPGSDWKPRDTIRRRFKGFQADLFQFYRIKFLPVFFYYQRTPSRFIYIFNPCDDKLIFDEPQERITNPIVEIFGGGAHQTPQYATFTGHYIIGLQKVDKIEDFSITIGETIGNSKTRLQEMGIHQETDTVQRFIDTNYTYATNWRYNVSNLLINHKVRIYNTQTTGNFKKYVMNLVRYNDAGTIIKITNSKEFTHQPITKFSEYKIGNRLYDFFEWNSTSSPPAWEELTTFIYYDLNYSTISTVPNNADPTQLPMIAFLDSGSGTYSVLQPDENQLSNLPPCVDPNAIRKGSAIAGTCQILTFTRNGDEYDITEAPISNVIHFDNNVYYSFHWTTLKLIITNEEQRTYWEAHHGAGDYIDFQDNFLYAWRSGSTLNQDYYYSSTQETFAIDFTLQIISNGEVFDTDDDFFVLAGRVLVSDDGTITYADSIYPGYDVLLNTITGGYEKLKNDANKVVPLQLTDTTAGICGIDDMLISKINSDVFKLSMAPLTNASYQVKSSNEYATITNHPLEWKTPSKTLTPYNNLFIPHRFNQSFQQLAGRYTSAGTSQGFFIIKNGDNEPADTISENDFEFFLAEGHDTLTIQKTTKEDLKYKTFNGSILFDRTSSKITRIMSNDITGSCLGYLNDLLSAKLSRYYFVANYEAFNITTSSDTMLYLTNAKNSNKYLLNDKDIFCGGHDILIASAFDIVKLVGSENVLNNITPSITTEQQAIRANYFPYSSLIDEDEDLTKELKTFYFKTFHYYTSANTNQPYIGFSLLDKLDGSATIGGKSLNVFKDEFFSQSSSANIWEIRNCLEKCYFVSNNELAPESSTDPWQELVDNVKNQRLNMESNANVGDGIIEKLPVVRIYRNSNFEQSDLTISTGGVKTLHPIYIQSTNKKALNNVLYMLDTVVNELVNRYGQTYYTNENNDIFSFLGVLGAPDGLVEGQNYPILRFCKSQHKYSNTTTYDAASFDSAFILDFMNDPNVANYVVDELPTSSNKRTTNTEIIHEMKTNSQLTNIQLFTERYFNFFDEIDFLSIGSYRQTFNDAFNSVADNITNYIQGAEFQNAFIQSIYSLVNGYNTFNQLKTYKMLFSKLGEFLQYPKLIYGVAEAFKNSHSVFIMYINTSTLESEYVEKPTYKTVNVEGHDVVLNSTEYPPIYETVKNDNYDERQKANVAFSGVVFRYHQQALGWQQMGNDLNDANFEIKNEKGNRHFIITLYDEFGRRIPNIDSSQGFKNNLKLEITLTTQQ